MDCVGDISAQIASWGTDSCTQGCLKTVREGQSLLAAGRFHWRLIRTILGFLGWLKGHYAPWVCYVPSWCGCLASIAFMGCRKDNAHTKLASRQTGPHGEIAALLAAVNLEGRKKWEGGVCTLCDLRFRSQEPSTHQKRFSVKK